MKIPKLAISGTLKNSIDSKLGEDNYRDCVISNEAHKYSMLRMFCKRIGVDFNHPINKVVKLMNSEDYQYLSKATKFKVLKKFNNHYESIKGQLNYEEMRSIYWNGELS